MPSSPSVPIGRPRPLVQRTISSSTVSSTVVSSSRTASIKSTKSIGLVAPGVYLVVDKCKLLKEDDADASDSDTESIRSDDVAPSSSVIFDTTGSKFDLEKKFPAILQPLHLLQLAAKAGDVDALRAVAEIFLQCFGAILDCMEGLPSRVRLCSRYEIARLSVVFAKHVFQAHVRCLSDELADTERVSACQKALQLMDMTMSSLKGLLIFAERELIQSKPLPELPVDESSEDEDTVVSSTSWSDNSTLCSAEGVVPTMADKLPNTPRVASKEGRIRTRTKSLVKAFMKAPSLRGSGKKSLKAMASSLSLVDQDLPVIDISAPASASALTPYGPLQENRDGFFLSTISPDSEEVRNIRSSLALFPDPCTCAGAIQVPRPSEIGMDTHYGGSDNDVLVAAKLPALIRILTSYDTFMGNHEFVETFFVCFRYFTTPLEFFQTLLAMYEEEPPSHLTPLEDAIWHERADSLKIRIVRLIQIWFELYWRHDSDDAMLLPIFSFITRRIAVDMPGLPCDIIFHGLFAKCARPVSGYYGSRLHGRTERAAGMLTIKEYSRTSFELPTQPDDVVTIDHLDVWRGSEEFARQLTVKASALVRAFDPEDAVAFWYDGRSPEAGRRISEGISSEKALSVWVSNSILSKETPLERADVVGFFLSVADHCVKLRNFGSAYALYSGCTHSSIDRMKKTYHELSIFQKRKLRKLDDLFDPVSNYSKYREKLHSSILPAVPLLFLLIRDIVSCFSLKAMPEFPEGSGNKMINFSRYRIITRTLSDLDLCHIPYKIEPYTELLTWLDTELERFVLEDNKESNQLSNEFCEKSKMLDPKGSKWISRRTHYQNMVSRWMDAYVHPHLRVRDLPLPPQDSPALTPKERPKSIQLTAENLALVPNALRLRPVSTAQNASVADSHSDSESIIDIP